MRRLIAMCVIILGCTFVLGIAVRAQSDSTPQASATPDERLCATPIGDMQGTPADDSATVLASPEGGSPVVVVPCGTPAGTPETGNEEAQGGSMVVSLVMVDIAFEPTQLVIPANTDVEIQLTNNGVLPHNFAIPDQGIQSEDYANGASGTITVNLPAGTYRYICSIPGHADAGMVGELVVQ